MTKKQDKPDPVVEEVITESAVPIEEAIQETTETIQESAAPIVEETIEPQGAPANPVTRGIDQLFERLDQIDQRLDQVLKPKAEQIVNTQAEKKEVTENAKSQEKPKSKRIRLFRRSRD